MALAEIIQFRYFSEMPRWVFIIRARDFSVHLHAATLPWLALAGLRPDAGVWRWSAGRAGAALSALAAQAVARFLAARRRGIVPRDWLLLPTGARTPAGTSRSAAAVFHIEFAGPFANIIFWLILAAASRWASLAGEAGLGGFFRDAGLAHLTLALLHLLPSFPMAAGGVFRAFAAPWGGAAVVGRAAAAGEALAWTVAAFGAFYAQPALVYLAVFAALSAAAERRLAGRFLPPGLFSSGRCNAEEIEVGPPPYARSAPKEWGRALRRVARAPFDALYERWRE